MTANWRHDQTVGRLAPEIEEAEHHALSRTWARTPGILGWFTTTNHKHIAMRTIITAMVFFTLAGILAMLMRLQLSRPNNHVLGPDPTTNFFRCTARR